MSRGERTRNVDTSETRGFKEGRPTEEDRSVDMNFTRGTSQLHCCDGKRERTGSVFNTLPLWSF